VRSRTHVGARPRRVALVAVVLSGLAGLARAQEDPHVGYVYPAGGQVGTTCEVTVGGQHLDGVSDVLVSGKGVRAEVLGHTKPPSRREANQMRERLQKLQKELRDAGTDADPAATAKKRREVAGLREKLDQFRKLANPQIAEKVVLRVTFDPDARAGERELRLKASAGLSNPLRFHADQWAEHREVEPNDEAADAGMPGKLPVVVNGQIMPGDVDRFRFRARADRRLVVAAKARALVPYLADAVPGWFQATLALYDAEGRELAYVDDYLFHPDPVLSYEIPVDGEYVLEIKDSIYRGREDFVYRITVGDQPFVTSIFPLGGPVGERTSVEVSGWNLPRERFVPGNVDGEPGVRTIALRKGKGLSNRVPFYVDTLPEGLEAEPNDDPESAPRLAFPLVVNGRIDRPGDRDVFRFEGRAGDGFVAEVRARRLGSPLDSVLRLVDENGRELARNDDHDDPGAGLTTHQADSLLWVTLPWDGSYYLHLTDAQHQGGEPYAYRLRVGPPRPDFELRVVPSSINVRAGATVPITVHALRRDGFDGEIALDLENAPRGFVLSGGRILERQDEVRLTLTAPPLTPDEPVVLRLVGRATIDGAEVRRRAVPADDMMQAFIYRHLVPAQSLMVAVHERGRSRPPFQLALADPVKLPMGGTANVRVRASKRRPAGKIRLELNEGPAGIVIQDVKQTDDGAMIVLYADPALAEPGLRGNLIVDVFLDRRAEPRDGETEGRMRTSSLGILPAIPFEIPLDG